jgi:hypothetical protein
VPLCPEGARRDKPGGIANVVAKAGSSIAPGAGLVCLKWQVQE